MGELSYLYIDWKSCINYDEGESEDHLDKLLFCKNIDPCELNEDFDSHDESLSVMQYPDEAKNIDPCEEKLQFSDIDPWEEQWLFCD